jgi:hypothetical protein
VRGYGDTKGDELETSQNAIPNANKALLAPSTGLQCTWPDFVPALTFLASYNNNPSHQHYRSALHVLKYLHGTTEYGIKLPFECDSCT